MTIKLKNLYLGKVDGDTESNNKKFIDLFYTGNNKYDEVKKDNMKFLIHGKKGTGKTILGRYIESKYNLDNIACKIYNKDDLVLGKLLEKDTKSLEGDEAIYLYKWIIYYMMYGLLKENKLKLNLTLNKKIFSNLQSYFKFKRCIKYLKNLYETRYPNGNIESIELIVNNEKETNANIQANNKSFFSNFFSTEKFSKTHTYKKTELYKLINTVEENLITCLKIVPVVIILDDLDELDIDFNNKNNSIIALNKLIEAFKSINMLFCKEHLSNSRCILLIRSDIVKQLNKYSPNLNKIIQDNSTELYWIDKNPSNPWKHPLMEMVLNKIKKTTPEFSALNYSDIYKKVFPEPINSTNAIDYMINNGFGRPRDIISYLEIIKKKYGEENCFRAIMFKECKQEYSNVFLNELYNEMTIHMTLDKFEMYIKLLRDFGTNKFFLSELNRYYKTRKKNYNLTIDINELGNILYNIGIIGNMRTIKGRNGCADKTYYTWGYRNDGNPTCNLEIKFSIHYGFRNALNVK